MNGIGHNQASVEGLTSEDKKKLNDAIKEIDNSMTRIAAERDLIKQTLEVVCEELMLDKKLVRRLAKVYHNSSFEMEKEENSNFEEMYSELFVKE